MAPALFRHVLFIDGFQPRGASGLHADYVEAARLRSALGDVHVEVGRRERVSALSQAWGVQWCSSAHTVSTRFEVLGWDDVVRRHWPRRGARARQVGAVRAMSWREVFAVWRVGLGQGVFARLRRISFGTWVMAVLPVALLVGAVGWGVMLMVLLAVALGGSPAAGWWTIAVVGWIALGALAAVRVAPIVPAAVWLQRLCSFTLAQARGELPELEARVVAMAERTAALWAAEAGEGAGEPPQELLLVGYSTGALLVPLVVQQAIQRLRGTNRQARCAMAVLTLGHCTPMLSLIPAAAAFRESLRQVAGDTSVAWVDYSAQPDVAACARVPPWWNAPAQGLKQSLSPRFHRLMPPQAYQRLRRDREALHRQYLKGPAQALRPEDYDYVALTAGPLSLRARHATTPRPPA